MISRLVQKLRDPEYRKGFVASQINIGIPFQIRALMKSRGWKQDELAKRADMLQPRISAILKPGKVRPNMETLRRIAEAFDVGLLVKFVPFSELARWSEQFDPESFHVPSFGDDPGFVEGKPVVVEHRAKPITDLACYGALSEPLVRNAPVAATSWPSRSERERGGISTTAPAFGNPSESLRNAVNIDAYRKAREVIANAG